jgi:hypothetical protein
MCVAATSAWATGPRLVVRMNEPFVVGGEVHPAGSLTLRTVRAYTPSSTLNEIWAGDRCLGLIVAHRSTDPSLEASRNAVLFVRDPDGRLVLRGFAYRSDDRDEKYRYELLASGSVGRDRRDAAASAVVASTPLPDSVLLSAGLAP